MKEACTHVSKLRAPSTRSRTDRTPDLRLPHLLGILRSPIQHHPPAVSPNLARWVSLVLQCSAYIIHTCGDPQRTLALVGWVPIASTASQRRCFSRDLWPIWSFSNQSACLVQNTPPAGSSTIAIHLFSPSHKSRGVPRYPFDSAGAEMLWVIHPQVRQTLRVQWWYCCNNPRTKIYSSR